MKISVAMAYYNGGMYIEEQMDTILTQLGEQDEVIVSVDGASDGSKPLLLKMAEEDKRIHVIKGPGKGVVKNFENAIRHWDGYWFGKYECYGDTFPHYWSTLSGDVFASYAQITGDKSYEHKAKASLRGCLNLFFIDGMASCAMVYPDTVNGKKAHYYDPWANDQDWALYYAVKWALDL